MTSRHLPSVHHVVTERISPPVCSRQASVHVNVNDICPDTGSCSRYRKRYSQVPKRQLVTLPKRQGRTKRLHHVSTNSKPRGGRPHHPPPATLTPPFPAAEHKRGAGRHFNRVTNAQALTNGVTVQVGPKTKKKQQRVDGRHDGPSPPTKQHERGNESIIVVAFWDRRYDVVPAIISRIAAISAARDEEIDSCPRHRQREETQQHCNLLTTTKTSTHQKQQQQQKQPYQSRLRDFIGSSHRNQDKN
jgi:hypothetical protein